MATLQDVLVPDIGDYKDVPVIDVLVKPGDAVSADDPLVTLESDKATMDVPAPTAGVVRAVKIKVGDRVSEGTVVLSLELAGSRDSAAPAKAAPEAPAKAPQKAPAEAPQKAPAEAPAEEPAAAAPAPRSQAPVEAVDPQQAYARADRAAASHRAPAPSREEQARATAPVDDEAFRMAHAGPGVRRLARELGVDLARVEGSGAKGRILREDLNAWVKQQLAAPRPAEGAGGGAAVGGLSLLPWPKIDFAKFGPVETRPLTRIQKIAAPNVHRNWVAIPHVTNHEDADVTDLEAFRVRLNEEGKAGTKVTLLAFVMKAVVAALQQHPAFNSSLDGDQLVLKRYYNLGFAADTPQGLVVPVIKDADRKGVLALAKETADLAARAREGKLGPADLQGASFTISSLGGIGGTYFTPIINAPEVAILGVSRTVHRPVWDGEKFAPRLVLPLSLSWDHRVLDGAAAARFNATLAALLADVRRLLL